MTQITAAMVKQLRDKTDAPMMECKKALTEANGDLAKAEELLRVKLGSKASKAASRIAAEGLIAIHIADDQKRGAMVEVNCETDFVAKNEDFINFVNKLARLIVSENPADVTALSALPLDGGTVESVREALVGKIGENMSIRRFQHLQTEHALGSYVHNGRIGVLVDYSGDAETGKDLAMHIAASRPLALDEQGVSDEILQAEKSVAQKKAAESGKPADIVEKIVQGSVQKFLKEVTLLSQPFIKDDKQSVAEMLKSRNADAYGFALYVVGEGLEKRSEDFAAEVAAAASGS